MRTRWVLGLVSICTVALLGSCGGNTSGNSVSSLGSEGQHCYPNGTCNGGLSCLSNLCVDAGAGGNGGAGVDASFGTGGTPNSAGASGAGGGAGGTSGAGGASGGSGGTAGSAGAATGGSGGAPDPCNSMTCLAPGQCVNGVCQCPYAETYCSGVCVDTQSNSMDCGACGHACAYGSQCISGQCQTNGSCQPAFCPSTGFGTPCCVTVNGPCGTDTGSGCMQHTTLDAGP